MNCILRFITGLQKLIYMIVEPILTLKFGSKKGVLPPIDNDLLTISATDLAEKIRNREVTSEQVCLAYIERIKKVNPLLNAVVEERFENALEEARDVDKYLQTSTFDIEELQRSKPLLGIPVTIKETCSVAGMSFHCGVLSRKDFKADKDGAVVVKLRANGAIILLVSNTPELCMSWETRNFVTGPTNNSYDLTRTSGGSSGGEGALLGAGASLIGIGSDVAGSIRLPAMFNGVFGHKPSPKIIPIANHYPNSTDPKFVDYFVIGPLVRYAKDLKLITTVLCDKVEVLQLDKPVNLSEIKVYFMEDQGTPLALNNVSNEIKKLIRDTVNYLQNTCKCTVMEHKFEKLATSCESSGAALLSLKDLPDLFKGENHNTTKELLKCIFGKSEFTFNYFVYRFIKVIYQHFITDIEYIQENNQLREEFIEKLGTNGIFLYPTFPTTAFRHNTSVLWVSSAQYLSIANTLGLPSTHIPCGFDKGGLPIGLQVIAGPNQDRLCFAVAEQLEKHYGKWVYKC